MSEGIHQIRKKLERLEKRKPTNTREYWKLTRSNKWILRKKGKRVSQENQKLLETKQYSRNLIKRINTLVVPLVRYLGPFLKWTRKEPKQMDERTRKLMTMHKALHPRDDVDRLYVSRKEGGRGLDSIEETVDASIQGLEDDIEKPGGRLITVSNNNTDNSRINRKAIIRKQKRKKNNCIDVLTTNKQHRTR